MWPQLLKGKLKTLKIPVYERELSDGQEHLHILSFCTLSLLNCPHLPVQSEIRCRVGSQNLRQSSCRRRQSPRLSPHLLHPDGSESTGLRIRHKAENKQQNHYTCNSKV